MTITQAWVFAQQLQKAVHDYSSRGYNDCAALSDFTTGIANAASAQQFVQNLSVLVPKQLASRIGLQFWNSQAIALNTGQASGYLPLYQNTYPDGRKGNPTWNGDQGHHFAAFFELGYLHPDLSWLANGVFEGFEAWLKGQGVNMGDIVLGMDAAQMGADLRAGGITPGEVSGLISGTLCRP